MAMASRVAAVAIVCLLAGCSAFSPQGTRACRDKASNPTPADGAKGVSPDIKLRWTAPAESPRYKVFFGRQYPPPFLKEQPVNTFDPGPLDYDKTYYWRVDIAGCTEGDTWKFTTFWYGDPNAEEMDVRLDGEKTDLSCTFFNG